MAATRRERAVGYRARAASLWHEYTRMRTAIFFLIGIALIVLVGSFVPQQDTSAQQKVDTFLVEHYNLNDLFGHLGLPLTQVFVAPLFMVLVASLFIALGACVLRRGRALVVRTLRGYPKSIQYWGEWGSWTFHSAFFLLVVAILWGKATGFQGFAVVTEGQVITEARASEDLLHEGLLFDGKHAGYQVRLNHFSASYAANGEASDFVSNVTVTDGGRSVLTKDIRVNDFLGYRDVDWYQSDYGWSPHIVVTNPSGKVVYDGNAQFFSGSGQTTKNVQSGVIKVSDFGYTLPNAAQPIQLGAQMAIFPDAKTIARLDPSGGIDSANLTYQPGGSEARNPVLQVQLYVGDLGLNGGTPQNVNALDTSRMSPLNGGQPIPLVMGRALAVSLPGADGKPTQFTVSFPDLKQYSIFMVKKDNGVPLIYLSFFLLISGLIVKLYVRPLTEALQRRRARNSRIDLPSHSDEDDPVQKTPDRQREPAGVA